MRLSAPTARTLFAITTFSVMFLLPPGVRAGDEVPGERNLKAAAVETGVLSRMMEVTRLAGLDDPEVEVGPLTLLAPSDAAFDALPPEIKVRLLAPENRGHLTDLLLYHALPGLYPTERLLKARVKTYTVSAIDGSEVLIRKSRKTRRSRRH